MNTEVKTAVIAVTQSGKELAKKLREKLGYGDIYVTTKLLEEGTLAIYPDLKALTGRLVKEYEALVFIMAAGIAVRMIAPYVEDKLKDPAVIVMDEKGKNVISLLSGHMGGANAMTMRISKLLEAHPVITTATDVNEKSALDNIIRDLDASVSDLKASVKRINYSLVHGEKVGLYMERDYQIDTRGFILLKNLEAKRIEEMAHVVCITSKCKLPISDEACIKIVPKDLVIGIGCRKNTPKELLQKSFDDFLKSHNIDVRAVKMIASIDIKGEEPAITALADALGVPFKTVSQNDVRSVEHLFEKSEFVKKSIGVYNVAAPAAYLLSGNLYIPKHKYQGITFAVGRVHK